MKMKGFESTQKLRDKYKKCIKIQDREGVDVEGIMYELSCELNKRNRAEIYKTACRVLKLRYIKNQFVAAAIFADAVINEDCNYFCDDDTYEINGFYTKSGNPVVVYF